MFIAGWFGIRTKELLLVLPLTVFLYSMLNFRYWKLNPIRWLAQRCDGRHCVPDSSDPSSYDEWSVGVTFNPRRFCACFSSTMNVAMTTKSVLPSFLCPCFPVSIARTLGIFLLWAGGISTVVYIWRRWIKPDGSMRRFSQSGDHRKRDLVFSRIAVFTMFQPDPRYFSGTMAR